MSTEIALSLQEILLSISNGLNDAQDQLRNQEPYDQFGRPNVLYTLPYLDFDIKVETLSSKTETSTPNTQNPVVSNQVSQGRQAPQALKKDNKRTSMMAINPRADFIRFGIANRSTQSRSITQSKIYSSISGRFVAVAPTDGLPQMYLQETVIYDTDTDTYYIRVLVGNSAGEKIPGAKVEMNFMEEESDKGVNVPSFSQAEVYTSSEESSFGEAKFEVTQITPGLSTVLEINVGRVSKLISIN